MLSGLIIKLKVIAYQVPTGLWVFSWTCDPEIVNKDDQEYLQTWVPECTLPFGDSLKAHTCEVCFAMCFPAAPCVWTSVESKL